jgi:hypothetical protein
MPYLLWPNTDDMFVVSPSGVMCLLHSILHVNLGHLTPCVYDTLEGLIRYIWTYNSKQKTLSRDGVALPRSYSLLSRSRIRGREQWWSYRMWISVDSGSGAPRIGHGRLTLCQILAASWYRSVFSARPSSTYDLCLARHVASEMAYHIIFFTCFVCVDSTPLMWHGTVT